MNNEVPCPACKSSKTMPVPESEARLCYTCRHEFVPEQTFVPQRVFVSYGHDQHVSLAFRLRDDVRARGHDAWFDEDRLKPGYDWATKIEEALQWTAAGRPNAAVLLLLTPHSVRRPNGYCLNEVARALALGLKIIPLMVADSEPPLSICRIQWLDMRLCIPISEKEAEYQPRFQRLVAALEEDALDFEGTQQRLLKALNPLPFDADILKHLPGFTGRQWIFDAIDRWLAEKPPRQRVFLILGSPGVGKTALCAWLADRRLEIAALHLCAFEHQQKSDPRHVVTSLAYQLATQLPDYEARLAIQDLDAVPGWDAATRFDNLIVQPLARLSHPGRDVIILIDALNESTREGFNALAGFIAAQFDKTPEWLRLIVTSQPQQAVTCPMQGLRVLVLDTDTKDNQGDIRAYLHRELVSRLAGYSDPAAIVEAILERSEGVFLYAERVCADLRKGILTLDRLDEFPRGLGALYKQFFDRLVYDPNRPSPGPDLDRYRQTFREPLRAILAAREPLPLALLQALSGWRDEEVADFMASLGALFTTVATDAGKAVKPYHSTIGEWLADEDKAGPYFVSRGEGHEVLAGACLRFWQAPPAGSERYILTHALVHLMEAGRRSEALALLTSGDFVGRACRLHLTEHLVSHLQAYLAKVEEGPDRNAVAREAFETLIGALDEEPESTWDYLRYALNVTYGCYTEWPHALKDVLAGEEKPSAQFFLADTHDMEARYAEAEQLYRAIAQRERDDNDITYSKACVKWAIVLYQTAGQTRDYRRSLELLDNVLNAENAEERFGNNYWRALYHRGVVYRHLHCFAKAEKDLHAVHRGMAPKDRYRSALYQLGVVKLALGQLDQAEHFFTAGLEARKARHALHRSAYEYRGLGELHALRGRPDAGEAFAKAIDISRMTGNLRYLRRAEMSLAACVRVPEQLVKEKPERLCVEQLKAEFGQVSDPEPDLLPALRSAFLVLVARKLFYLDVLSEADGTFANQLVRSDVAHRDGDWHATVVVFLFDEDGNLALQRRGEHRARGLWDTSVTGHCDAFESPVAAAVRETWEELGVVIDADRLRQLGSGPILRKIGTPDQADDVFDTAQSPVVFRYPSDRPNNEFVTAFVARVSTAEREAVNTSPSRTASAVRWVPFGTAVAEARDAPQRYASGFRQFLHPELLAAVEAARKLPGG